LEKTREVLSGATAISPSPRRNMAVADRPTACVAGLHRSRIRVTGVEAAVLMRCEFRAISPSRHIAPARAIHRCCSWHGATADPELKYAIPVLPVRRAAPCFYTRRQG